MNHLLLLRLLMLLIYGEHLHLLECLGSLLFADAQQKSLRSLMAKPKAFSK